MRRLLALVALVMVAAARAAGGDFRRVEAVTVDVGNGSAFEAKVQAVESARRSVEMQYYRFGNDFAGSFMAEKLMAKARAGVKVRLIVDAKTSLGQGDFFKTLVKSGEGNLHVAYFRPFPADVIADLGALGFKDYQQLAGTIASGELVQLKGLIQSNTLLQSRPRLATLFRRFVAIVAAAATDAPPDDVAEVLIAHGSLADVVGNGFARLQTAIRQESPGTRFDVRSWFDLTKWNHHKLLIVDGQYVHGGGRNLEDAYHWEQDDVLRERHRISKYIFMDADFFLRHAGVAARALETFDAYWQGATAADSRARIPHALEEPADEATARRVLREIRAKAEEFARTRSYPRTYKPIHSGRLTAAEPLVAYVENRMFPRGKSLDALIHEEPSEHALTTVSLMDELKAGEEIVLHNAYLFLPARIQEAIVRALRRGVRLIIQTNSPESSDMGYVAKAARCQYAQLFKAASPPQVKIYEYMTKESLHTKVWIIGDYLVIGSVNADPRCELLDTGNSIVVGPSRVGPSLAGQYKEWLAALRRTLLVDKQRSRAPELTALREVTPQLLEDERTQYLRQLDALPEPTRSLRKQLRQMIDAAAAKSCELSVDGAKARQRLQTFYLQY